MANQHPNMSGLTPFQKGSAPNPKGKTSEQRKLEVQNAASATRIRAMFLQALEAQMNALAAEGEATAVAALTGEALRLMKDSEDRGLGTPVQTVIGDADNPFGMVHKFVIEAEPVVPIDDTPAA